MLVKLADRGFLRRVRRGVYRSDLGRASSLREETIAAWLELDGAVLPWERGVVRAVISHASAASLLDIGSIVPGLPEITVRRAVRRRADVTIHVAPFASEDVTWLPLDEALRVPVTNAARTIIDLLLVDEETDYLERALREAFVDRRSARGALAGAASRRTRARGLEGRIERLAVGSWPA